MLPALGAQKHAPAIVA